MTEEAPIDYSWRSQSCIKGSNSFSFLRPKIASLIERSMILQRTAGVRDSREWSLALRSIQILYRVACATILLRVLLVTVSFEPVQSAKAVQVLNARKEYPSLRRTKVHRALETGHLRNRWSLSSSPVSHRQQEEGTFIPHLSSLDLLISMLQYLVEYFCNNSIHHQQSLWYLVSYNICYAISSSNANYLRIRYKLPCHI